ncbi:MAG: serine hydrolase [Ginsengibacter sp.]
MKSIEGKLFVMLIIVSLAACNPVKQIQKEVIIPKAPTIVLPDGTKTDAFLEDLLKQYPQYFDSILAHRKDWNVQIIYTQIDRGKNNLPKLTNYYFNVNPARYFYPASTVKLPTALFALQRLNELKATGIDKNTTMLTEAGYSGQTAVFNDPLTSDGRPTIASYIKKIFLVSDNDAMNRLYEFLGQEYLNDQLHKKGYTEAQILHRLQIALGEDENRHTNPIKFLDANNNVLYQQPLAFNQTKYVDRNDSLGNAFYQGDKLIYMPMNFSKKNRISLESLHNILRSVIFPNTVLANQRFNLTPDDFKFVYKYMSQFPPETNFPPYDSANYQDAYGKFLLYGAEKGRLPKNIRIFNKIGDAYGHMIDVAYVVDFDKKIEFFLSAEIYCNKDGVMNDDKYDYETIGYPFMKNLGKVMYDYDASRKRAHYPDLSPFKMVYDK